MDLRARDSFSQSSILYLRIRFTSSAVPILYLLYVRGREPTFRARLTLSMVLKGGGVIKRDPVIGRYARGNETTYEESFAALALVFPRMGLF